MITVLILAAIGILLNILGRCFILRQDKSLGNLARTWVAFCPGAELVYLIVRWEHARTGATMCALSLALAMPLVGQVAVVSRRQAEGTSAQIGVMAAFESLFREQTTRSRSDRKKSETERALKFKTEKVEKLNRYLSEWYAVLLKKEPYLCTDMPEEITEFNQSAASYHELLAISKAEAADLNRMTGKSAGATAK